MGIASYLKVPVRVIKPEPVYRVYKKPLVYNGTKNTKMNKNVLVKSQKYIHTKCRKSSCITSLTNFKNKFCTYMKDIYNKALIRSLIRYNSYQNKKRNNIQ